MLRRTPTLTLPQKMCCIQYNTVEFVALKALGIQLSLDQKDSLGYIVLHRLSTFLHPGLSECCASLSMSVFPSHTNDMQKECTLATHSKVSHQTRKGGVRPLSGSIDHDIFPQKISSVPELASTSKTTPDHWIRIILTNH